ncbi:asparagine synthase (glutamine-hydrolyzing) [Pusillimonas sp. TS35]|uniref:asparagine synthase (glutamine-hydrolyzing) n=1 Tax=Paracandidimonas lactea TaxID=2895524 RepID=UPI001370CDE7|nr:asparagine synthase (glutamine-hydrolyzing) [Paracandidimonas lactea]MYN11828.1 asparagine synthase (glutamine-hydrolyzing) [Pusillimonas sp. TS35]
MCGLAGFYTSDTSCPREQAGLMMAEAIAHRGPDDTGIWSDDRCGLTLAHKRLAILDLSPAGHQPMHSACRRYALVFNGEIYNHLSLREQLAREGAAPSWRGHADTETLLACFAAWGVEKTLQAAIGMFAIALWDKQNQTLTLARDRLGEKPLYWGWLGGNLYFGSELKALKAHPAFRADINRDAVAMLLRHGYIGAPHSIYRGIHKLQAGSYVQIALYTDALAQARVGGPEQARRYWHVRQAMEHARENPFTGSDDEAVQAMTDSLNNSIRGQMLSDVPLGAFLSGGIDSSLIVALMQAQSSQPVRTFTIGFDDPRYNEAEHADAVARHLGTQHTQMFVRPKDAQDMIPDLPGIYDEPFADSSQLPTLLVCKLAREHVTVALSGDAGDELCGGYNTYRFVPTLWKRMRRVPGPLRRAVAGSLDLMPSEASGKFAALLRSSSREAFFRQLSSHWDRPEDIALAASEPATAYSDPSQWPDDASYEEWMMAVGAQSYMADDILVKVDRAAMANSLEVRVPMLDHRFAELAWRMPLHMKIRNGQGKWLLRQILYKHVPPELIERPKKGFSVPLGDWLRGPLREWAESLLAHDRLQNDGYLHPGPIRAAWQRHLAGKSDNAGKLWNVLMFQAWLAGERA